MDTDETEKLLTELNRLKVDFYKLKPREQKAIKQTEHFLQHVFPPHGDGNYYSGSFLLGPNFLCTDPICEMPSHLNKIFNVFAPSSEEEVIEILEKVKKMFDQYKRNMQYGVKVGMVRPMESCRAWIDTLRSKYPEIALKGPKGIVTVSYASI